ncbi:hypothetical protein HMPREF9702_02535 [Delftia acidovorans CCUG 15835]|nr:hypothetical protein HMPREF9702_02535 [Delftia acidovorans CCUG 15835]
MSFTNAFFPNYEAARESNNEVHIASQSSSTLTRPMRSYQGILNA